MEAEKEFETIRGIVKNLLETEPKTRNSDKFLIYSILKQFTKINISFEEFDKCPNLESIRRVRQKLFEEFPELRADEEVEEARNKRKEDFSNYFSKKENPDVVMQVMESTKRIRGIEIHNKVNPRTHGVEIFSK